MKKLLSYIFIGLVAAGCTEMYGPEQHPTPVVPSDGLELRVLEVGDNTAKVQLAPAGEASYYSYCVLAAENAEAQPLALDSVAVYRNAYKSEAVQSGAIRWTAEEPSAEVLIKGLESDAYYYVYAVAGSVEGIPSSVVSAAIHTSDKVNPSLPEDGVTTEENVITMTFSEKVTVAKDLKLVANYYGVNSDEVLAAQPLGSVDIPAKAIVVKGNVVTITVPDLPAGAVYAVSVPAKAFLDSVGNGNEEIKSGFGLNAETYDPEPVGIVGEIAKKPFKINALDIPYIYDLKPVATKADGVRKLYYTSRGEATAEYLLGTTKLSQVLQYGEGFGKTKSGDILFLLSNVQHPEIGSAIKITLAENVFQDDYANPNEEWVLETVYAYPYTMENIYGTFAGPTVSPFAPEPIEGGMTIVPVPEGVKAPKGCNCMVAMFSGVPTTGKMFAAFNPQTGVLKIPSTQIINEQLMPGMTLLFLTQSQSAPWILHMYEEGVLSKPSEPAVIFIDAGENSGMMDAFIDLIWKKQPEA